MEIPVNSSGKITSIPNYVGFGFYVRSQIVIRKLGILKALVKLIKNEIQVKLISAYNRQILASVTFGPISLSESKSEILMKAIKPVTLVEYSEAFIKIESNDMKKILLPDCKFTNWVEGSNVITYINLWQSDSVMPTPFTKKSCTYVLMTYNLVGLYDCTKLVMPFIKKNYHEIINFFFRC